MPTTSFSLTSQETLNSTSGLRLDLLVAPSNASKGEMLIRVDEYNTLDTSNNATAPNEWRYSQDLLNPYNDCGTSGPLGFAVFQGYYDMTNFTSGNALLLWNTTYVETCSSTIYPVTNYLFNPGGDIATAYNAMGLVYPFDTNASVSLSLTTEGYWTGGQYSGTPASFLVFPSGTYTIIAADEWGKVVLSYFTVAGTGTTLTTSTSSVENSTGNWSEGAGSETCLDFA